MTFHIYLYVRGTPEQEEFTKKGWLINDLCPHARLLHACNSSTKKRLNMQTHTHTNTHIDTHTHKHTYRYSETGEEAQTCTLYLACFQTCSQECSCNWLCCGVLAIIARCESEPIQNHRVPRAAMKTYNCSMRRMVWIYCIRPHAAVTGNDLHKNNKVNDP